MGSRESIGLHPYDDEKRCPQCGFPCRERYTFEVSPIVSLEYLRLCCPTCKAESRMQTKANAEKLAASHGTPLNRLVSGYLRPSLAPEAARKTAKEGASDSTWMIAVISASTRITKFGDRRVWNVVWHRSKGDVESASALPLLSSEHPTLELALKCALIDGRAHASRYTVEIRFEVTPPGPESLKEDKLRIVLSGKEELL